MAWYAPMQINLNQCWIHLFFISTFLQNIVQKFFLPLQRFVFVIYIVGYNFCTAKDPFTTHRQFLEMSWKNWAVSILVQLYRGQLSKKEQLVVKLKSAFLVLRKISMEKNYLTNRIYAIKELYDDTRRRFIYLLIYFVL